MLKYYDKENSQNLKLRRLFYDENTLLKISIKTYCAFKFVWKFLLTFTLFSISNQNFVLARDIWNKTIFDLTIYLCIYPFS